MSAVAAIRVLRRRNDIFTINKLSPGLRPGRS